VEFHAAALAQLNGLPTDAFDALVARVVQLVDAPWDAAPLRHFGPGFRIVSFGAVGLACFYVDDSAEQIRIFDVVWAG
jgi:hypothetical protein